jgi:hypothetical protein
LRDIFSKEGYINPNTHTHTHTEREREREREGNRFEFILKMKSSVEYINSLSITVYFCF